METFAFPKINADYWTVYQCAGLDKIEKEFSFKAADDVDLIFRSGPFSFLSTAPVLQSEGRYSGITMCQVGNSFQEGQYLIVRQEVDITDIRGVDGLDKNVLADAGIISVINLIYPGMIIKKVFSGFPILNGCSFHCSPSGPLQISANLPVSLSDVCRSFQNGQDKLLKLDEDSAQRFRLMSRWYRRAHETDSYIDKFLFLVMCLDIYPAKGEYLPERVSALLKERVFSEIEQNEIKAKLDLGRIYGLRSRIVHNGLSSSGAIGYDKFIDYTDMLDDVVRVSMGDLLSIDMAIDVRRWLDKLS